MPHHEDDDLAMNTTEFLKQQELSPEANARIRKAFYRTDGDVVTKREVGNDDPIDGEEELDLSSMFATGRDKQSDANSRQVGGDHYKLRKFQHWDMVAMFDLDYFQGQITKYVIRWKDKNGLQDLEKAQHFLEKYIELEKKKIAGPSYNGQE